MAKVTVAFLVSALVVLLSAGVGSVGAATPGSAVYQVQVSSQGHLSSLTVNETVTTTANPASDNLILSLVWNNSSLSYSKSMNASSYVSPFLPAITNQTFTTTSPYGNLSVSIHKTGSSQIEFQGASRSLADYAFAAATALNGSAFTINGTIETFQSGLVYAVTGTVSGQLPSYGLLASTGGSSSVQSTISATLVSTSLPLSAGGSSASSQAISAGISAGVVVSALAVGLGVRRHNRTHAPAPEGKPEHWVD